jgi:ABC-type branched-subunit amino acid transport system ATPase component
VAYVRFIAVQKTYDGDTLVVRDFDLDVARGECLTLLGPSGSGKTTCPMMLAGFESLTHGEIMLDGRPINEVSPYKRDIGVVFQKYALFPHTTVRENLLFPLEVRRMPRAEVEAQVARARIFTPGLAQATSKDQPCRVNAVWFVLGLSGSSNHVARGEGKATCSMGGIAAAVGGLRPCGARTGQGRRAIFVRTSRTIGKEDRHEQNEPCRSL